MLNAYHIFFAPNGQPWETGSVWSNMVAWVICGIIAIVWARRKLIKWDRHREAVDQERHEDMKAHISHEHDKSRKHLEETMAKRKR